METNEGIVKAIPIVGAIGADTVATLNRLTLNELFYIVTIDLAKTLRLQIKEMS